MPASPGLAVHQLPASLLGISSENSWTAMLLEALHEHEHEQCLAMWHSRVCVCARLEPTALLCSPFR